MLDFINKRNTHYSSEITFLSIRLMIFPDKTVMRYTTQHTPKSLKEK